MTKIIFKTTSLESKRSLLIKELNTIDAKNKEIRNSIENMSSNSNRVKDRLFYYEVGQLKQKLEKQKAKRQEVRNRIGKLNKMIKNKHRFENGNIKAMV